MIYSTHRWDFYYEAIFYYETKHDCVVHTSVYIFSPECYSNKRTSIISISNAFYFFVSSSLIVYGTACLNRQLNWTCPGGYLLIEKAIWETHSDCEKAFDHEDHDVKQNLQNKCNNVSACHFTVEDSSFDVKCIEHCSKLDFRYKCVRK